MTRLLIALSLLAAPTRCMAVEVRFDEDIRPIFAEYCLECHGPDSGQRKADLRLDLELDAEQGLIEPHSPQSSELFQRLVSQDDDIRMPPKNARKQPTSHQIDKIRQWIEEGAAFEGHWAYRPVLSCVPPAQMQGSTAIDQFILARLQEKNLSLAPQISRQQWLRRVSLDLLGLPASWSDVDEFTKNNSPDAYAQAVDRLLASPRYGERWGRYWLDIARYADTHGGSAIGFTRFPFSYTYRDYVIGAFNGDLPYDRFVMEQLAADQLGLDQNDSALAGLGFLTVGMQFRNQHDIIDDQIDVITRGLQGLTVACARCHDHKYDTISTEDYYSLYATLAPSRVPDLLPEVGLPVDDPPAQEFRRDLNNAQMIHDDMAGEQSEIMRGRLRMQIGMYLKELAKGTPEQDLSSAFLSFRTDDVRPLVLNRWREYLKKLPIEDPVFGPWLQMSPVATGEFEKRLKEILQSMKNANGDKAEKRGELRQLATGAPAWNPLVLQAIEQRAPKTIFELADVYGELFGSAHKEWLAAVARVSHEASPNGKLVPDEDEQHMDINSPIHRQLRHYLYSPDTPTAMTGETAITQLNRTVHDSVRSKENAIHNLHLSSPASPPRAMVLSEDPRFREYHVFRRGNPLDRGPPVASRYLAVLSGPQTKPFINGRRRLGLAQQIVHPNNPLTRRVIVNWVWQQHFGQGLVRTADDFGIRGRPPTHPQLLDYLAEALLSDDWSLKSLHRRIVLSDVYRQAAVENETSRAIDPDNELLWRMPRRKLDMEAMRDSLLACADQLDTSMGGRPVELVATPIAPRRSVYGFVNRDIVSSFASTFDSANPNACTAIRPDTSVPQQTLFALNSEFMQQCATNLAGRVQSAATDDQQRVLWLYQQVYSRLPEIDEVQTALEYVQSGTTTVADRKESADVWQKLAHVLLAANEFVFAD